MTSKWRVELISNPQTYWGVPRQWQGRLRPPPPCSRPWCSEPSPWPCTPPRPTSPWWCSVACQPSRSRLSWMSCRSRDTPRWRTPWWESLRHSLGRPTRHLYCPLPCPSREGLSWTTANLNTRNSKTGHLLCMKCRHMSIYLICIFVYLFIILYMSYINFNFTKCHTHSFIMNIPFILIMIFS